MRAFLTLTTLLFLLISPPLQAQERPAEIGHRLGVSLPAGSEHVLTDQVLETLRQAGISLIEVEGTISDELMDAIEAAGFFLFVKQIRPFTTAHQLSENGDIWLREDQQLIDIYESRMPGQVTAYGLFQYPDETSPLMFDLMSDFAGSLMRETGQTHSYYYESAFPSISFLPDNFAFWSARKEVTTEGHLSPVIHFYQGENNREALVDLRDLLRLTPANNESVVILDIHRTLEMIHNYDFLAGSLQTYVSQNRILFPLPASTETSPPMNFMVLLLLAVTATYFIHYKFNTIYRRSNVRYFMTHKLFVEDVMEHRLRGSYTGTILFLQFTLLSGLYTWLIAEIYFSPLGIDSLFHHFPFLNILESESVTILIWGIIAGAVLQIVPLLIIYLPAFKARTPNQTLNVFGWPLHLNLLIIVAMVTIRQSDGSAWWLNFLVLLFPVIWFINFIISTLDVARYLKRFRFIYIFVTISSMTALIALLISWAVVNPEILEPVRLALSLP